MNRTRIVLSLGLLMLTGMPCALAGTNDGVVIGATKIADHGPDAQRFNFVLVAEGYQQAELGAFASNAQVFVNYFFSTSPFNTNQSCFNFWRIDVASSESGADNPLTCGDGTSGPGITVNTYFDAHFCNSGIRRLLLVNSTTALRTLNALVPNWDVALIMVNSTNYGGSGGTVGVTSLAGSWKNISMHELGHAAFGLGDEYEYWAGCSADPAGTRDHHSNTEPSSANLTVATNAAEVKWADLFYPDIPIPTTTNADCSHCDTQGNPFPGQARTGLYEGAHYYHCGCYRPAFNCMMRNYAAFCPVCERRILQVLQPYQPGNNPPILLDQALSNGTFRVSVPTSSGKNYALEYKDSLKETSWTMLPFVPGNGNVVVLADVPATNQHRFYRARQW